MLGAEEVFVWHFSRLDARRRLISHKGFGQCTDDVLLGLKHALTLSGLHEAGVHKASELEFYIILTSVNKEILVSILTHTNVVSAIGQKQHQSHGQVLLR